ncbi:MAG: cobalamin-dependent protein [Deltaproteobacteria bacterium]|nr:cobalamin-dependent protein [Deltaproteobacteria bacterium]
MQDTRVYLADIRHNFSGVLGNECMPLGVSYLKAVMDRDLPEIDSRLYAYPDRLASALRSDPPHVLMLSNYMWNEWLSFHFARLAKQLDPNILVVMGGPNISLEPDRQIEYVRNHPEIDVYVLGEGDFLARDLVREFLDAGLSIERLTERDLPSCVHRRPDGEVVRTEMWNRQKEVEEIPSPWMTGVLDEFFDGKLAPMMETNRGCPFQCTFCVQGVRWYTKVHNFTIDRVREEIDYVGRRVHDVCPDMTFLRLADSNFGTYGRDVEIAGFIGEAQKNYGWPTFLDATTGKNRPDRVIQALEKVNGALIAYQAVQSLDDLTLKNIKRSNISNDAYEQPGRHRSAPRCRHERAASLPGDDAQGLRARNE